MESIGKELREREEALLDPDVRRNRAQVESLLAEDFLEFGSSGRVWTRDQIFNLLATEAYSRFIIEDFNCTLLSEDVALLTYCAVGMDAQSGDRTASLRSSIWTSKSGTWRLRFHQGTRIP
jgi:hypothetical protein